MIVLSTRNYLFPSKYPDREKLTVGNRGSEVMAICCLSVRFGKFANKSSLIKIKIYTRLKYIFSQ